MPNTEKRNAISSRFVLAIVCFTFVSLAGCLNGGGSGSDAGTVAAPVVPPPVVVPNPITGFADAGGGNLTVTSANTLAPGAIIVITGTTSYNGTFTVVSATATSFTIAAPFVANDATGVWVAGGGVIAGCTTTGATGVIGLPAMTAVASRFTGVAPLSVFFDATATTGAVAQPFHEMLYTWNFGDPGSGTWAYGSRAGSSSKNAATGAVAAHVYETPGTYTVSLSVTDGTNTVTNTCIQIAVQDPNVVYAGANTRCYTQGAVSAGACPGGGTEFTNKLPTDFHSIITTDLAAGRRLLFARGETWTTTGNVRFNVNGPWTVGAYGAGAKPIIDRGAPTSVILGISGGGADIKDGRIMDLQLQDNGTNNVSAVRAAGLIDQMTLLRIDVRNTAFGFTFDNSVNPIRIFDQLTIAESTVDTLQAGGGNSMFITATRWAILGNSLDNAGGGEHNFRSMYFDKFVLSNNKFARPAATKANITLRAPDFGSVGGGGIPVNTYSQYAVVSDNEAIGANGVNVPVNTSIDGAHDARTRHIVFERNWMHSYPGSGSGFNAIRLNSDFSTIRNNVIDLSGISSSGDACIDIRANGNPTQPNPTGNWIYNNTCYSTTAYTGPLFPVGAVSMTASSVNTTAKNNLLYTPNAAPTAVSVVSNFGTGNIGASGTFGNSSNVQAISGPVTFTSLASPLTPAGAKPTAGYVIGGGVAVPGEISDFFLNTQPATPDVGAVLH